MRAETGGGDGPPRGAECTAVRGNENGCGPQRAWRRCVRGALLIKGQIVRSRTGWLSRSRAQGSAATCAMVCPWPQRVAWGGGSSCWARSRAQFLGPRRGEWSRPSAVERQTGPLALVMQPLPRGLGAEDFARATARWIVALWLFTCRGRGGNDKDVLSKGAEAQAVGVVFPGVMIIEDHHYRRGQLGAGGGGFGFGG